MTPWSEATQTAVEEALAILPKFRGDYISTMLTARIPGWQRLDEELRKASIALELIRQEEERE